MKLTRFATAFAVAALACAPVAALAAPLSYVNVPLDTVNASINVLVSQLNATQPGTASTTAASGTTTATARGLKNIVSVTGLTTAASTAAAAMTVTNASVSAASVIHCQVNGYAGTGSPVATKVIPGVGSYSFVILNVATSGALNATVPVACLVFN